MSIVEAWKKWVEEKNTNQRKLIVQTIDLIRLSHKWQAYEKAVESMLYMDVLPKDASESLSEAAKICVAADWKSAKIKTILK